jgi:hypothetical protein
MRNLLLVFVCACVAMGTGDVLAQPSMGTIALAWDPAGQVCNLNIVTGRMGTLYVLAQVNGMITGGTTGAEFRLAGFPTDWFILSVTSNPEANTVLGDPLGNGCGIFFPSCQAGTAGVVSLYAIHFVAVSDVSQRVVTVVAHAAPGNPSLACARLTLCDGPVEGGCSQAGFATINYDGYCVTAAVSTSWSAVRQLYQ